MKKGFTLVEIMIVVAIVALLATLVLPGLLRTRLTTNESTATTNLRTVYTAAVTYRNAQATSLYPSNISSLITSSPPYITGFTDSGGTATKTGYTFSLGNADAYTFTAVANPTNRGTTGNRSFCIDVDGLMYASASDFSASSGCAGQSGATPLNQ